MEKYYTKKIDKLKFENNSKLEAMVKTYQKGLWHKELKSLYEAKEEKKYTVTLKIN